MGVDDYFVKAGEGHRLTPFEGVTLRTSAGQQMLISQVWLESGAVVPMHSHPHEQVGVCLSGRLRFTVDGVTRDLGPGDCWRIPGGVPHRVEAFDGPALAIDVFHPVREDYLPPAVSAEEPRA